MENTEIKNIIKSNIQQYDDWTIKVVQDVLVAQNVYITNTELLALIQEVKAESQVEETPITEEV